MAKLEIVHAETEDIPASTETIEARIWGVCGTEKMPFYIGSGLNFQANGNLWLEVIYSVEGAQLFYTRNFLQQSAHDFTGDPVSSLESRLDDFVKKGDGRFGFGDMLPDTSLTLIAEKHSYSGENEEEKGYTDTRLEFSMDTGAVFGRTSPAERAIVIKLAEIELEEGVQFMRELIHEIGAAWQGKHPDPASFRAGSSEWSFIWQLNRRAYDIRSADYEEDYFRNPLLVKAFDGWLKKLPRGGQVLDAGCGHGRPVIDRLLEKGFQVTGSDFSPEMLRRASQQFPQVPFLHLSTTEITHQEAFDGICSFNSMLYLDPIDLLYSICQLHCALKPGGWLFLYGFDSGPDWRGEPFHHILNQWMWSWHYGIEEAAALLEEHGYFTVKSSQKVQVDEKEAQRIAEETEKRNKEEAEYLQRQASNPGPFHLPFPKMTIERSPYAYVLIAQRCER